MASIKFVLRTHQEDTTGHSPLYIRIIKDRTTKFISTGVKLKETEWDDDKQRVKKNHSNSARMNASLIQKLADAEGHVADTIRLRKASSAFQLKEAIKGNWNARFLERQIESLLLERVGLSTDKEALIANLKAEIESIEDTIKDPYILEFTGFKELATYSENDLETALLDKIQHFLQELGTGFCFEARQKRITMDGEHDRVDLVFVRPVYTRTVRTTGQCRAAPAA